jgi:hypothetical protein
MLSTILQYSTLDIRFLETNIKQCSKFSEEIIIPICDHFFNGEPENEKLLNESFKIASKYPKCSIYIFEWQGHKENAGYYHNLSRYLGTSVSKNEWLLFLDSDEIVDDNFYEWFNSIKDTNNTYWLTCYWYFREPIYRSTSYESCGLLIKKENCKWNINIREERQQFHSLTNFINGDKNLILVNGEPIIHHFSWVRSKEQMLTKVKNWGHKADKNWINLVEEEFNRPFNGTDFVHGYQYNIINNKFNI